MFTTTGKNEIRTELTDSREEWVMRGNQTIGFTRRVGPNRFEGYLFAAGVELQVRDDFTSRDQAKRFVLIEYDKM